MAGKGERPPGTRYRGIRAALKIKVPRPGRVHIPWKKSVIHAGLVIPGSATPPPARESGTVPSNLDPAVAARLKRDPAGLVPAIVQEYGTGHVLMLAWMDDEALRLTRETGEAHFFSRSRGRLWRKGETPKLETKVVEGDPKFSI